MRPIPLLALSLLLSAAVAAVPASKPLGLGKAAPLREVRMASADAREISIAEAAGKKGTLVIFTCNHCPWVKAWEPRIAAIGNAALDRGVGVIAINPNDPAAFPEDGIEEMKARTAKLGFRFPYVVDTSSDVARAFGATRTPEVFLFDAKGRLVYRGTVDDSPKDEAAVQKPWLRDAVEAVVAGRKVAIAETKALGCSIKYREKAAG